MLCYVRLSFCIFLLTNLSGWELLPQVCCKQGPLHGVVIKRENTPTMIPQQKNYVVLIICPLRGLEVNMALRKESSISCCANAELVPYIINEVART